MHTVKVSRQGPQWLFVIDQVGSGQADTLTGVVTAVNNRIQAPLGQSVGISWVYEDEFVREALAVHTERARLKQLEAELDAKTRSQVVRLMDRGLTVRDISTLLGISAARVSQLRGSGFVHGDETDTTKRAWVVTLFTDTGPVTKFVRGNLPEHIRYDGVSYKATGGGHSVNGDDTRYSYIPRD